jgi:diguanylate cyclase (GGDEF)-like protein
MSLYQDRGGVLWIGTQNGISRANLNVGSFGALSTTSPAEARLRSNDVKTIVEDLSGDVWIGTYGGGLHRWRVQEKTVEVYSPEESSKLPIIDNRIMSLLADSRGRLWVGTRSKGLQRIDADRKSVRSWRADKSDPNALHADGVTSILEGRDGEIWIGTYRGGLSRWDEEQNSFVTYRHDPNNPTSLGSDQITGLIRDRRGKLWIATDGAGLDRFDPENGQFTHFTASGKPGALGSNLIFAVLEDSKGDLWVATGGSGLYRWRVETRGRREASFEVYNSRNVLPNDTIYGILEDEFGKLWISSNAGLTRLDPHTEETAHFDINDGLQSNEFNFGAFHKGASGRLYFGGNSGINYFFATDIRTNTHVPDVRISGIDILNKPLDENQHSQLDESLHLSHKDDMVTFRFASLDFTDPRENRYAYMLEGFNEDWVDAGEYRQATYTSLPPGDYVFRVRGSNNDGIWSETDATLKIVVAPPPWATNYAYTLYLSLAVALVLYVRRRYTARLRAEERYSQTLEREVQRRTHQLEERNFELHEVNVRLEEASLTDSLTGLRNRRYLLSQIPGEAAHILRSWANGATPARRPSISFLMIDLDGFKEINDTYGHAAGDQVLLQLRDLLNDTCRAADYLIRWGGDEFLVVGKDAERENTERLATRLRNAIANHNFAVSESSSVRVSSSIGFARFPFLEHRPDALSWEQVLAVADRALYQAKHLGKDQWVGFSATPSARRERILRRLVDDPESLAVAGEIRVHRECPDKPGEDYLSRDAG